MGLKKASLVARITKMKSQKSVKMGQMEMISPENGVDLESMLVKVSKASAMSKSGAFSKVFASSLHRWTDLRPLRVMLNCKRSH